MESSKDRIELGLSLNAEAVRICDAMGFDALEIVAIQSYSSDEFRTLQVLSTGVGSFSVRASGLATARDMILASDCDISDGEGEEE